MTLLQPPNNDENTTVHENPEMDVNASDPSMVQYQLPNDRKDDPPHPPPPTQMYYSLPMQQPPPQQMYVVLPNTEYVAQVQPTVQHVQYAYGSTASANNASMATQYSEPVPQGLMSSNVQIVSSQSNENAHLLSQDTEGNYVMKAGCNVMAWTYGIVGCIFLILFPFVGIPFVLLAIFQRNADFIFDDKSKELVVHLYGAFIPFGCFDHEERIAYESISDIVLQEDYTMRVNGECSGIIFAVLKNGSSVKMTKGYTARSVASLRARKIKEMLRVRLNA
ncbi:hypothetical protein FDP41_001962 [Naegleria fowleri]|uniref:Uncharacterized protein n=1 Tax=Naegleria fowleri TaxID=5763 RepID=A0A6A5BW84_NAEFO|nr:uncharacterized protein FDP41_001962 [Naegleria fowleri]KAF0978892.1 hypothetical protein FDP41_001962 [Naegleria fowleri]CAG4717188.1 unnamed protein product [Naegleria fowleri]